MRSAFLLLNDSSLCGFKRYYFRDEWVHTFELVVSSAHTNQSVYTLRGRLKRTGWDEVVNENGRWWHAAFYHRMGV